METYTDRVARVVRDVERLGRGTRAQIASDLRVHPTRVSDVLNQRLRRDELLTRIEAWIRRNV